MINCLMILSRKNTGENKDYNIKWEEEIPLYYYNNRKNQPGLNNQDWIQKKSKT